MNIEKRAREVIQEVMDKTTDCNLCVDFNQEELDHPELREQVESMLWQQVEVADVIVDEDCYDVILYTSYIPGYQKQFWEEEDE